MLAKSPQISKNARKYHQIMKNIFEILEIGWMMLNIKQAFEILKFAKIFARKIAKILKFAKINARQILERAIRENKCSRKFMLAKIYVLKVVEYVYFIVAGIWV